jgi:hypothetical protein
MDLAKKLVAGVDIWLNTPLRPLEASGTSGMKATFNGVPNLSILDGWWIEGCIEGITGWAIGDDPNASTENDAASLYQKIGDRRFTSLLWGPVRLDRRHEGRHQQKCVLFQQPSNDASLRRRSLYAMKRRHSMDRFEENSTPHRRRARDGAPARVGTQRLPRGQSNHSRVIGEPHLGHFSS